MYNGTSWINSTTSLNNLLTNAITSSLSANYMSKWDGSKLVNGLLYDDGTHLMMGTSTSNNALTIMSNSGNAQLRLAYDSSNYTDFYVNDTGQLSITQSSSAYTTIGFGDEALRILPDGKVGIGTVVPESLLNVNGTTTIGMDGNTSYLIVKGTSTANYYCLNGECISGWSQAGGMSGTGNAGQITYWTSATTTSGTSTLSVNVGGTGLNAVSAGSILIGTSTNVIGELLKADTNGLILQLVNGMPAWVSTSSLGIQFDAVNGYVTQDKGGTNENSLNWNGMVHVVGGDWSVIQGATNTLSYWSDANTLAGTDFYIQSNNLGLGTSTPQSKLSVAGDIGIHNQNGLRLYELEANGFNYINLKATSTVGDNVTYYLPEDGDSGRALMTDGTGNLYWGDPQGSGVINDGASGWLPYYTGANNTLSATSSLFLDALGNLGVGTTTSTSFLAKLNIDGNLLLEGTDRYISFNIGSSNATTTYGPVSYTHLTLPTN
jgi:hypothetical protein